VETFGHFGGEPVHFVAGVTVDDSLRDSQRLVQIAQRLQLPILLVDGDVELADTLGVVMGILCDR
jgi:hypothetical protein